MPTESQIAVHFDTMDASVDLINSIVDGTYRYLYQIDSTEAKRIVTANTDHLEWQATTEWYRDSANDKTAYTDAVASGKAYVE